MSEATKLPRMISEAKKTPPIGALKVAAIPPAAPQATRVFRWLSWTPRKRPKVEPQAEPIWTMGPSRPTEPPDPIESAEARAFTITTRGLRIPLFSVIANMTSGTPWPLASRAKKKIKSPTRRPPV